MAKPLQELNVLEDLYDEGSSDINLKRLAGLLGLPDKELAKALDVNETTFSRKPYAPQNAALNQWMGIFNLIIDIVHEAEPELSPEQIKLKMQRWLKLARPEFDNKTPIEFMLAGKIRRVKNFLEQLSS